MHIFYWLKRFFSPRFQKALFLKLSRKEKLIVLGGLAIFLASGLALISCWFEQNTQDVPINGGTFKEGIIGQPTLINPLFSQSNDIDRDLSNLIFSSILKADNKGNFIFDLASDIKTDEDGKIWDVYLKDNIFWHDGEQLTSDDIIFTVETVQNPATQSPLFNSWQGVILERVSKRAVRITLKNPYYFFENNLKDLKIIPQHIFVNIPPENIKLSEYGLAPIGSGPFKFKSLRKRPDGFITDFILEKNENYYGEKPYLDNIAMKFYPDEEEVIKAFNNHLIDGFGGINPQKLGEIYRSHQLFEIYQPKYYALFFNQNLAKPLQDKNVRIALNLAVDKNKLVKDVLDNKGLAAEGPILPFMKGYNKDAANAEEENYSLEKAEEVLEMSGWKIKESENGEKIRSKFFDKEEVLLEFDLITPKSDSLIEAAHILESIWAKIGAKVNVKVVSLTEIEDNYLNTRSYQTILFGNILNNNPDLFSFWHSSQKFPPGLNLALYENKTADALIEKIRQNFNEEERLKDLSGLQDIINQDRPAIFLYSPFYLYITNSNSKGFGAKILSIPSERFSNISNWSVKQIREFK